MTQNKIVQRFYKKGRNCLASSLFQSFYINNTLFVDETLTAFPNYLNHRRVGAHHCSDDP